MSPHSLRTNPWAVLAVLCLGLFMALLDTTIVNIAIPAIGAGLDASLDEIVLEPGPANIVEDMVRAIRTGAPVATPGESGRETVRIIDAIYRSSRAGGERILVPQGE